MTEKPNDKYKILKNKIKLDQFDSSIIPIKNFESNTPIKLKTMNIQDLIIEKTESSSFANKKTDSLVKITSNLPKIHQNSKPNIEIRTESSQQSNFQTSRDLLSIEDLTKQIEKLTHTVFALQTAQSNDKKTIEETIKRVTDSISSLKAQQTQSIPNINNQLQDSLKPYFLSILSNSLQNLLSTITQLSNEVNDIIKNHKELENLVKQTSNEFTLYISTKKREIADIFFELKNHKKNMSFYSAQQDKLESLIEKLSQNIKFCKEAGIITNLLFKQDEIDRKSISLVGYKNNETKKSKILNKPVVSLEKNCTACINNAGIILPAFKMACLAYNSSPILYKSEYIGRLDLLLRQEQILESLENKAESFQLFEDTNYRSLTPELPKIKIKLR